jgi:hypothetical protein
MARAVLAAGAEFRFQSPGPLAQGLAADYWARQQTTAEQGIRTVGLPGVVWALSTMPQGARTSIAAIDEHSRGWHFVAFVDDESGRLIACAGVEQQSRPASGNRPAGPTHSQT